MANPGARKQLLPLNSGESSASPRPPAPTAAEQAALVQGLHVHLQGLADEILLFSRGDGVAIALAEDGELCCRATSGIAPPLGTRIDARSGLTGACLSAGTLLRCDDSEVDARVDRQVCRVLGIRSMVCVPVRAGQEVVGIFEIFSTRPNAFLNLDVARLHAQADDMANCFTAEEALARAAVATTADLGAAGTLAPSWTPVSAKARQSRRTHLSSRAWQALLGTMVLALGVFLLWRAIRASGPAASAWVNPQSASAAPSSVELPPAVTNRLQRPGRPQPPPGGAGATRRVASGPVPLAVRADGASRSDQALPQPPDTLVASAAAPSDALHELVSSMPVAQPSLPRDFRISSGMPEPVLLHRVEPLYPPLAKQSGIAGAVVLQALVDQNGALTRLRVASGNSLLAAAALRAVRQWRYRPPRLNGQPVEVPIQITLNFDLGR